MSPAELAKHCATGAPPQGMEYSEALTTLAKANVDLAARIKTVRDDLAEAIDGSDELRNYDQWISRLIRTLDGEAL